MKGFVSFVGAGPGDPDLLTVRAVARLQAAEVVLYDDLASGPILTRAGGAAGGCRQTGRAALAQPGGG